MPKYNLLPGCGLTVNGTVYRIVDNDDGVLYLADPNVHDLNLYTLDTREIPC